MQVVRTSEMEWGGNIIAHRAGTVRFKRLFDGVPGSPDNFTLVLTDEHSDFFSPRHRHNFDQIRYCLKGSVPIGKASKVGEGEVGYFPEGVPYGPQEGGPDRTVLVLQMGGASGEGYMSPEQQNEGRELLSREGRFEGGVFKREKGEGKANMDAFEALWLKVMGRPVHYAEPAYSAPIVMRPEGFAWRPMHGEEGVEQKFLGLFPERGLLLGELRLAAGATLALAPSPARRLILVTQGEGQCGDEPYDALTAIHAEPGEAEEFTASSETRMLMIELAILGAAAA